MYRDESNNIVPCLFRYSPPMGTRNAKSSGSIEDDQLSFSIVSGEVDGATYV